MDIKAKASLFDVLNAAQLVQRFLSDKTFDDYQVDLLVKSAVERQFIFRNVLTHGYTSVSDEVVWDIVQTNLPVLIQDVQHLLNPSTREEESL